MLGVVGHWSIEVGEAFVAPSSSSLPWCALISLDTHPGEKICTIGGGFMSTPLADEDGVSFSHEGSSCFSSDIDLSIPLASSSSDSYKDKQHQSPPN